MKILVFGSVNIDRTYSVPHFVNAGETLSCTKMETFSGGKGFNQAVALARAGCDVYFAGAIGDDGQFLKDHLASDHINVDFLQKVPGPTGHAVIQVTTSGQNCIIIFSGANASITTEYIDSVLKSFAEGDVLVLQNETPHIDYIMKAAHNKGIIVALNPSPFNEKIAACDLNDVDYLIVNEIEGELIAGKSDYREIIQILHEQYPDTNVLLTLGSNGSVFYGKNDETASCGIYTVDAIDTTAAGDTFLGYFLGGISQGECLQEALERAAIAGGIAVSRKGAAPSIPTLEEVKQADRARLKPYCADRH